MLVEKFARKWRGDGGAAMVMGRVLIAFWPGAWVRGGWSVALPEWLEGADAADHVLREEPRVR